jgi:thioredoxin reductase (NADPH)
VIIATGVSYGLLDVEGLKSLQGAGIYYSATNVEARLCRSSAAHVVGGGNSAGQAAMFLSQTASEVSLLVRGSSLRKMSSYLADRLLANKKVRVRYGTEVVGVEGVERICGLRIREPNGEIREEFTAGLFVFIGAKPRTDFLPQAIAKTKRVFFWPALKLRCSRPGKNLGRHVPSRPACPEYSPRATAATAPPNELHSRLETVRRR